MALNSFTVTAPNQALGAGDTLALAVEQYTGVVEQTIDRKSKAVPFIDMRSVRGTATITNQGVGESTLQVVTAGSVPDATSQNQTNNAPALTVDTLVLARTAIPLLDSFQKNFDYASAVGREHGKKIAKFMDNAFFIQAAKAAALTTSAYGALPGFTGGTTKTLAAAGDASDPAALYSALSDLFAAMEDKDVDPSTDDVMVALRPSAFYALLDAEQIVNGTYVSAKGTVMENVKMLKAFGVPVVSSNNVPNTNITAHALSNSRNSNAYNGDFSKLTAVAFAPDALLAGETISLATKVWFSDEVKMWFIDAYLAFGVTPNRNEYAGRIVLP
jgi:hypothetical protein